MAKRHSPIGMISFPHLFSPSAPAPGADPRYSVVLLFDEKAQASPEFKAMQAAVDECAREAFKSTKGLRLPFRDAGEKAGDYAGYKEGMISMNFWSKTRPGIVDARNQEILVPDDVWAGQLARVSYGVFSYDVSGNRGVSVALNNVQIAKSDMPRIDGRVAATDDFDALDDEDDDIPF